MHYGLTSGILDQHLHGAAAGRAEMMLMPFGNGVGQEHGGGAVQERPKLQREFGVILGRAAQLPRRYLLDKSEVGTGFANGTRLASSSAETGRGRASRTAHNRAAFSARIRCRLRTSAPGFRHGQIPA